MWERGGENIAKSNMWFVFFCTCACHLDKFISVNRTLVDFPLFYSEYLLPSNTWTMRFFTANMEKLHDPSQDTGSARLHLCAKKNQWTLFPTFWNCQKRWKNFQEKNERITFYAMLYLLPVIWFQEISTLSNVLWKPGSLNWNRRALHIIYRSVFAGYNLPLEESNQIH